MVARGGAIVNGTGTMAVSPTNLAVGANTITATGAGTFTIYSPEGGTCASGTATITGSPVTLVSGVNTVTAEGTGNFTVTPSNIIRSKDKNNISCTVTGATWGNQGRSFVGGDDYIDCGSISISGAISIGAWSKYVGAGASISNYDSDANRCQYQIKFDSASSLTFNTNTTGTQRAYTWTYSFGTTAYHHAVVTNDLTSIILYADGIAQATKTSLENPPTSGFGNTAIGRGGSYNGVYFLGTIGEVRIYNRVLSVSEIMQNYQATKWRFQ